MLIIINCFVFCNFQSIKKKLEYESFKVKDSRKILEDFLSNFNQFKEISAKFSSIYSTFKHMENDVIKDGEIGTPVQNKINDHMNRVKFN